MALLQYRLAVCYEREGNQREALHYLMTADSLYQTMVLDSVSARYAKEVQEAKKLLQLKSQIQKPKSKHERHEC
jgi:hypothetical protein